MRHLFSFILIAVVFISCKNQDTSTDNTVPEIVEKKQPISIDNKTTFKGEFIYAVDAAVLTTKSDMYAVRIDDKMHELQELAQPLKRSEYDMVNVILKGKLVPNPLKVETGEGWDQMLIIEDILEITPADISELDPEERAHKGVFLSFQYPIEIPGVSVTNFMKTAINETRKAQGKEEMKASDMLKMIREKSELLEIDRKFLSRSLNEGFSGGEKKRNEIFQMAMLEPKLSILDETDSGLDIDALRIVANGVNKLRSKDNATIVITHYQRLLDYIVPDFVHVLYQGRIVKTGGKELALELEKRGYDWIKEEIEA